MTPLSEIKNEWYSTTKNVKKCEKNLLFDFDWNFEGRGMMKVREDSLGWGVKKKGGGGGGDEGGRVVGFGNRK